MTTISNDTRAAARRFRYLTGPALAVIALSSTPSCSQEFSSCSETRDCAEVQGGSAGTGGSVGGSGGTSTGEAGAPSSSGEGGSCSGGCGDDGTCCEGECVDTSSDAANCGACGHACEAPHAESECVLSGCVVTRCEDGFVDCNGEDGCETEDAGPPGAPSPFLPMAGAYTGAVRAERSLKPKFAWRAPEALGTCGSVSYELELTRECEPGKLADCAFEDPDVRVSGLATTDFTPSEPLPVSESPPVGALYAWRVRACESAERCSEWSRVSYVNVGRLVDDINSDGYSDLVQVGSDDGKWGIFFSGDGATPLAAHTLLDDEIGAPNHGRLLGDVNGDQFPDLVLYSDDNTEPPRVILGGTAPASWASVVMSGPLQTFHRGARAGDLDGDGFADVAVSEFELAGVGASAKGIVRLYRGRSDFSLAGPINFVPPEGTTAAQFGAALEGGVDSNADGYAELFILDNDDGFLHVVRGKGEGSPTIDASVESPSLVADDYAIWSELFGAGDVEADGYDDLAISITGEDGLGIHVLSGGIELPAEPVTKFVIENPYFMMEWSGGVDLGSDGRSDLVVHAMESVDNTSRLFVLPGSEEEQSAEDLVNLGSYDIKLVGRRGMARGDYDGDGVLDLSLGEGGGTKRQLLRGGTTGQAAPECEQAPASFATVGDWCAVEVTPISAPGYVGSPAR